jgi:hypothetical protein
MSSLGFSPADVLLPNTSNESKKASRLLEMDTSKQKLDKPFRQIATAVLILLLLLEISFTWIHTSFASM